MRAAILILLLSLLFLAGCATDRRANEPAPERRFFESPDVDSLH